MVNICEGNGELRERNDQIPRDVYREKSCVVFEGGYKSMRVVRRHDEKVVVRRVSRKK